MFHKKSPLVCPVASQLNAVPQQQRVFYCYKAVHLGNMGKSRYSGNLCQIA